MRRVVALLQSLQSSRQRIMNSLCCILVRTNASTARPCICSPTTEPIHQKRQTMTTVDANEELHAPWHCIGLLNAYASFSIGPEGHDCFVPELLQWDLGCQWWSDLDSTCIQSSEWFPWPKTGMLHVQGAYSQLECKPVRSKPQHNQRAKPCIQ